jgi:hypothetical protein
VLLSVCVESCWVDVVWLFDGWEWMTPSKVKLNSMLPEAHRQYSIAGMVSIVTAK